MKVLCVLNNLGAGGAERHVSVLIPALRRRRIDARVLALDGGGPFVAPLEAAGVPLEVANMRHQFDIGPLLRSPLVRLFAPDVVLSQSLSGAYVGHAVARLRGVSQLYVDHRGVGQKHSRRREAMITLLAPRLSGVIAVSEEQREVWLDRGCPRERLVVIPNGVQAPAAEARADRDAVRRELGIDQQAVVALMVASLRPVKRVPDFVRAVRLARERCPSLVAVIVGDGLDRGPVEAAAAGDPGIRLLGHRDDVPRILPAGDLLALSSAHEAMPMAILEAMAAGLPVLATRVGGVPKVVVDGETGLLVEPSDPDGMAAGLLALAGDRQLRLRMGRAGQQRCLERWDSERMVDAYVEVLQDAAERRARQEPRGLRRRFARSFVDYVDRKGWVTRERVSEHANVLTVVNVWPEPSAPTRAPFVSVTVRGLLQAGVETDVLYVRGYRGAHCYLLACAVMALLPLAEPGKYRLVHSHAGETALPARFFWQGPVLGSYWGSDILGLAGQGSWRSRARFALTSRLLRLHTLTMSATTTKSEQMAQRLPARARARNWVIPDGVDLARVAPIDRLEARAALGWAPDELAVITVGRRTPSKRVWLAERAANLASREIPGLRWQAVSTVPPEQMPLYYSAADVLLHAAASEGSPNVVKEAMACNLPVVATDVGDIRELLAGVEPSAVCEGDAEALAREIVRVLRDGRRSNGRDLIARLSLDATTARTLECYRSLGLPVPLLDGWPLNDA